MNVGLKSDKDLTSLKKGDVVMSVAYREATESVEPVYYIFDEYVKTPDKKHGTFAALTACYLDGDGKPIPTIMKNDKGKDEKVVSVHNIEKGLFLDYKEGVIKMKAQFQKMLDAADKELKKLEEK